MEAWGFVSFFCLHMRFACFNNEETIGWVVRGKKKRGGGLLETCIFPDKLEEKDEARADEGWTRP